MHNLSICSRIEALSVPPPTSSSMIRASEVTGFVHFENDRDIGMHLLNSLLARTPPFFLPPNRPHPPTTRTPLPSPLIPAAAAVDCHLPADRPRPQKTMFREVKSVL